MNEALAATAYHEAGHAVAALALGRPVNRVSILPTRERMGWCEFRKGVFRPTEDWLEREAMIALAGLAAEARFTGDYAWPAAAQDERYVRKLVTQRGGERKADRLIKRLLAKTENLLGSDENWRAIELIATELLERGEISGRAAVHLYERAQQ